jgi:aspartyl-tRNA(Asn)/glutamyl-tRNA(Gln) amidotransferase subunit C
MISREELLKLAALARLRLDESEIERFQRDIAEMLNYVRTLEEVDTSEVAATSTSLVSGNVLREDEVAPSLPVEDACPGTS